MRNLSVPFEGAGSGKRYLVISPQGFGDSLEATPMLVALKHAQPQAVLDVLVLQRPPEALFEGLKPIVDGVLYLPLWESGRRAFIQKLLSIRWRRRYDATFLTYPAARWEYQLLAWMIPSKRRYAHSYESPSLKNLLWLNTHLCQVNKRHNVLRNLDLLQMAGLEPEIPNGYTLPDSWKASREEFYPDRIVAHVGTVVHHGRESRRWPPEYFAEVLTRCSDAGMDVWLAMGPSEVDVTRDVQSRVPGAKIFTGSLAEVSRFLSSAGVVLTNDNGIGHLAAGTGTAVVTLFGPTPLEHAPYGENAVPLRPTSCPPCFDVRKLHATCALDINYRCLREDLTPAYVYEAVQKARAVSIENRAMSTTRLRR